MLSMKDIARLSGVSLKTVSRVMNNSQQVKLETRDKVMKVVEEHGYRRNIIAKSLKEQKTRTIIVFVDSHSGDYWGTWHTMILKALMTQAKKIGYKVLIAPSNAGEHMSDETDGFHFLSSGLADGAIIMDNVVKDQRIDYLEKYKIPHVVLGNCSDYAGSHWVDLDNRKAGEAGVTFLAGQGYGSVAFLLGDERYKVNQERAAGFADAMMNLDEVSGDLCFGVTSAESAYERVRQHLADEVLYRAYFVSGDERALGVYRALQEAGKSIPDEVAVLGIDNLPNSRYLYPSLSSLDQPEEAFAEVLLEMLIGLIDGSEDVDGYKLIDHRLMEREST